MTLFKVHQEVEGKRELIGSYQKLGSCLNKIKKELGEAKRFFIERPTGQIEEYILR